MKKINEIEELKMITGGIGIFDDKSKFLPCGADRPPRAVTFPPYKAEAIGLMEEVG